MYDVDAGTLTIDCVLNASIWPSTDSLPAADCELATTALVLVLYRANASVSALFPLYREAKPYTIQETEEELVLLSVICKSVPGYAQLVPMVQAKVVDDVALCTALVFAEL